MLKDLEIQNNEKWIDNPSDIVICNLCLEEKLLIKKYWDPSVIKYIEATKTIKACCRQLINSKIRCKRCKNFNSSMRSKKLKKATPVWANLFEIKKLYAKCPEGYEVDHIIPLRGINVSGLHVETNLQYLSVIDNRKKSNNFKW